MRTVRRVRPALSLSKGDPAYKGAMFESSDTATAAAYAGAFPPVGPVTAPGEP
jgi:hypothetical protein